MAIQHNSPYTFEVRGGITFPSHTINGYYPLENGVLYAPEELLLFDRLCMMSAYNQTDYPAPDVIVAIGKGGLADMQGFAYLMGSKNSRGKSNVRMLTAQTEKYDDEDKAGAVKILHCPDERDLSGAKFIVVGDDMVDEGGSLDAVFTRVDAAKPIGATVIRAVPIAKLYENADGLLLPQAEIEVVGRYVGPEWLQLAAQFEKVKHWHAVLEEMHKKYPNWKDEVKALDPVHVLPKLFPEQFALAS